MISGRCAACKYLRRRCPADCIFSPYFPPNNPQRFASVHRIYGASNVAKMLQQLPAHLRAEAADTLCFEAECRIQDSVYGCVKTIFQLHQEIRNAESQLAKTRAEIVFINAGGGDGQGGPQQPQPQPPPHHEIPVEPNFNFFPPGRNDNIVGVNQFIGSTSSKGPWFI